MVNMVNIDLCCQSSSDYQRLQDSCSRFEAMSLQLKRKLKDADYTFHFWKNFPGKMTVNSLSVSPLVTESLKVSRVVS